MPAQLVSEFDVWRPGYDSGIVSIFLAGTTSLAPIFADPQLSRVLPNPQTLLAYTSNDISYGKFAQPIYVGVPYFLKTNIDEDTGIHNPPLSSLSGEDASNATVTAQNSAVANTLQEILGRTINAEDYGEIIIGGSAGSAATNTETIQAAIGALGTSGTVHLPPGLILANPISMSAGVILQGAGMDATTLQIIAAGNDITIAGDDAGFRDMTLDGNNLTATSVAIYALNRNGLIFENFVVQNFDSGPLFKGGSRPNFKNFHVLNCNNNCQMHGDKDTGNTTNGGPYNGGVWKGGRVGIGATIGLDLKYVDAAVSNGHVEDVQFGNCPGTALRIKGARFTLIENCIFTGNTINVDISDDLTVLTPSTQYQNKVQGVIFRNCTFSGGSCKFNGNAADVVFDGCQLLSVNFNMVSAVDNNIILKDCFEDGGTTITGDGTRLVRQSGEDEFNVTGLTNGAAATRAWGVTLDANELAYIEVKAQGVQRNGTNLAMYHAVIGVKCTPAALAYHVQSANFVLGDVLTGTNSNATARIISDNDAGTSGTLSLETIQGTFQNNEPITGTSGGAAQVNGAIVAGTHQPDAYSLPYGTQTANYSIPDTITGATSLATARAIRDNDAGSTGILTIDTIVGTFQSGEVIAGVISGSATTTGSPTANLLHIRTPFETDEGWDISFAFSNGEVAFQVQGNTNQTVDWNIDIKITRSQGG